MKKKIAILLLIIILSISLLFAQTTTRLSVPLNHQVYTLLRQAELRGLIGTLPRVTPYQTQFVVSKLYEIASQSASLSRAELELLDELLTEFLPVDKTENSVAQIFSTGKISFESEKKDFRTVIGAVGIFDLSMGFTRSDGFLYDSRNAIEVFFTSDITNTLSLNMNAQLRLDKLDNRLFNPADFTLPGEGFYIDFIEPNTSTLIPMNHYMVIMGMHPEVALGLFNEKLLLRFASIKRDWGVGRNNIQISGSAREFNALESTLYLTPWLRHHFIVGSLGKFALDSDTIGNTPFPSDRLHENAFNNNYSAHRIELDIFETVTLAIWEATVWQKRFELGYLNPFSIFMMEQNHLGDFDNMLAGFDAQWRLPGMFRLYGAIGVSEMNEISPKLFFKHPRNVMAFQAGIDFGLPVGVFSSATIQYTHLSPFFYTHAPVWNIWNPKDRTQNVSYVNKGEHLGYPLEPNSDEFLFNLDIGLGRGWRVLLDSRYQRRSGQYGYTIEMFCDYTASDAGKYELKAFTASLMEERVSVEMGVEKKLQDFPLLITCSYRLLFERHKEHISSDDVLFYEDVFFPDYPRPVLKAAWSPNWSQPTFTHVFNIGFTIFR